MRAKFLVIGALVGAIAVVIPVVAFGGVNNGPIDRAFIAVGGDFETPSGNWQTVDEVSVSIEGPLTTFVLTGEGFAQDYGSGGVFKGQDYAAMKVRLKVNGDVLQPGAMTFASNAGVKKSASPRTMGNTLTWFYQSGSATLPVQIQVKNLNTNDLGGLDSWNLTVYFREQPV